MEMLISFVISLAATVVGGVVCHLIVKWLDRKDKKDKDSK